MADVVTDLTGEDDGGSDDETITCKRCTFLNSIYLNNCEICEAPLRRSSEQSINRRNEGQVLRDNIMKTQTMDLVESLKNENADLRKQMQDLRAQQGFKKRKHVLEQQNYDGGNAKRSQIADRDSCNFEQQPSATLASTYVPIVIIDSSTNLNYNSPESLNATKLVMAIVMHYPLVEKVSLIILKWIRILLRTSKTIWMV